MGSFIEKVGNALGELQSLLYTNGNMYKSQSLLDAMAMFTELNAAILDLEVSLERINDQQANCDQWELQTAEEWKLWAEVLVENVRRSTEGKGTSEATRFTQRLNTRSGLRLHACQEEYLWLQTRHNFELQKSLEINQNSAEVLIQATVTCQISRNECYNAVRIALNGLREVPEELDRFRDQAEHLLALREESNQCLSQR
ncbi:uncharacterized protein DMAD_09060 [Drosophila madeirensis]|uniref:Uncharacterized protein n=1 Tax=Drosophila madeirensis TaxID=30013 RepID=A0AAU9F329_DROMD